MTELREFLEPLGENRRRRSWPADPSKPTPTRVELVAMLKGRGCETRLTIRGPYPAAFAVGGSAVMQICKRGAPLPSGRTSGAL